MNPHISESLTVIQVIQLILAPGIMINACGLLLLSISNKFSNVLNRIRTLTEEKRNINLTSEERELHASEIKRKESIQKQTNELLKRAQIVRNAVFCYLISVGMFVITSLLIGIEYFAPTIFLRIFILAAFLSGMIIVFIGTGLGVFDTIKAYNIVKYEVLADK